MRPFTGIFQENNYFVQNLFKLFWKLNKLVYLCCRKAIPTDGAGSPDIKTKVMNTNFDCVVMFATKAAASAFTFHLNRRSILTRQLGCGAIIMPVSLNDEEMEIVNKASKYFNATNR